LYCFFDSHDVGVEAVETSSPFPAQFFVEYAQYCKISGPVLSRRWELRPGVVEGVLF
jgi:hypothetical protein